MLRFPEFNPDVSLPELDAIDGCSQEAQDGFAYASTVNNGLPCMPLKMVTHSWRNKFCFLLAAILADALNREKYDEIARLLAERQLGKLVQDLFTAGKLDVAYWVCAFSVNQHTGICATPPPTDSTDYTITPCPCSTPKHFVGDLSATRLHSAPVIRVG